MITTSLAADVEAAYAAAPGADHLARRLSGWKAGADMCALLHAVLHELQAIHRLLERDQAAMAREPARQERRR